MDEGVLARVNAESEAFVTDVRPELDGGADAATRVKMFAHGEQVAAAGKVLAARPAVRTNGWQRSGYRSAEEWLAGTTGTQRPFDYSRHLAFELRGRGAHLRRRSRVVPLIPSLKLMAIGGRVAR